MSKFLSKEWISYFTSTHFWGPLANWGFVIAGVADTQKHPDYISANMTSAMCVYSMLFMRFAWMVQPRNMLLFACHFSNESVQLFQLGRKVNYEYVADKKEYDRKFYGNIEEEK
eukprot:TRINITY_DN3071_c0_g1_i2.p1 TRINITY_DN3071_c0_g1~~TRINITY_DN3071_c0_g1_i2.p1  ORF type:complete len:114 (-),score=11.45 TRINITY_DN3071_c0_g1_i2:81-422(-)